MKQCVLRGGEQNAPRCSDATQGCLISLHVAAPCHPPRGLVSRGWTHKPKRAPPQVAPLPATSHARGCVQLGRRRGRG